MAIKNLTYKVTTTIGGWIVDVGQHHYYSDAIYAAQQLSKVAKDVPFRIYRWTKDHEWVQESYYINGE